MRRVVLLALVLLVATLGCQNGDATEGKEDSVYLLIFALNVATLEPVVIKDCVDYRPKTEQTIEGYVADLEKGGQICEKGKGIKSWTCTDQKSVITKLTLLEDRKQCETFPQETADKMKKIMGR